MLESCARSATPKVTSFIKAFVALLLVLASSTSSASAGQLGSCLASLDWPACGDQCTAVVDPHGGVIITNLDCNITALTPNGNSWSGSCSSETVIGTTAANELIEECLTSCATNYGHCPLNPPGECEYGTDCENLYPSEEGSWVCSDGLCELTQSPLVLHLPDYLSTGEGDQSWWKKSFCGPEAPTVCLDWWGNGNAVCTAWPAPGSEIAFVVNLSDDDMFRLADGAPVRAEPWRHFFGNVTMGPEGSFPFVHGFAALAAHCGQDPEANSEIDLTGYGSSLYVWEDHSVDGNIDSDEILELQDLGVESLGDVRRTGKKGNCGNTFPFESHATCTGNPGNGKCGTWLDVFFEARRH